jgi:hypothetical protein
VNLLLGTFDIPAIAGLPVEMAFSFSSVIGCHSCRDSGFYDIYGIDTAKITDIEVLDPVTRQALPGATVASSSGTIYPVGQQSAVPEPTTLMLCAGALGALVARCSVLKRRKPTAGSPV